MKYSTEADHRTLNKTLEILSPRVVEFTIESLSFYFDQSLNLCLEY